MMITVSRGLKLMQVLTETSYLLIKEETEDMTPQEAANIWEHIEPFYVGACARAGTNKAQMEWNDLVRKMTLVQRKAEKGS